MKWLILVVLLSPLVLAGNASSPCLPDRYDPNQVGFTYDAATVRSSLLGTVTHTLGIDGGITARYCDPDGDPVAVRLDGPPAGMTLVQDPNSLKYTIRWKPTSVGLWPIYVIAADQPPSGTAPMMATGTILWRVVRPNSPPVVNACGARYVP